jgi:CrcB protein
MFLTKLALIFIGGGLGALTRYLITEIWALFPTVRFPAATLGANITACLIMVLCIPVLQKTDNAALWRLLLITGYCGGLSTFSTFSLESAILMKQGHYILVIVNVVLTTSICLYIAWKGVGTYLNP